MALSTSPLRSSPDDGCSRGQGQGVGLVVDQGVMMVWVVHWAVAVAALVGVMGSLTMVV